MRLAHLIFIFLGFFLLGGHNHSYASARHTPSGHPANSKSGAPCLKFIDKKTSNAVLKNSAESEDDKLIFSDDKEDEDILSARKYVVLVKYFFTAAYTFILSYLYRYLKDRLPFCIHLSDISSNKYLLQRVLRI